MNEQFINELATALRKVGTIHTVGEEWVSYIGEIPNGGVPYCGQEVTRTTYSALWGYAQEKGLVKSEAEWQQLATANGGNVPYYSSGDDSTTFRMPKLVGYVRGASSQSEAGEYVAEGLPNITGEIKKKPGIPGDQLFSDAEVGAVASSGALSPIVTGNQQYALNNGDMYTILVDGIGFDASKSNAIYGNSSHVTPETSVVLFGVYAFGVVTNAGELDVSAIARDVSDAKMGLNGVVRSVNGSTADASGDVAISLPSPKAYITETWVNGASWYRKYSDGWIEQGGEYAGGSSSRTVTLHTTFTNTAYRVQVTIRRDNGSNYSPSTVITNSSSFRICTDGPGATSAPTSWYAYGN